MEMESLLTMLLDYTEVVVSFKQIKFEIVISSDWTCCVQLSQKVLPPQYSVFHFSS